MSRERVFVSTEPVWVGRSTPQELKVVFAAHPKLEDKVVDAPQVVHLRRVEETPEDVREKVHASMANLGDLRRTILPPIFRQRGVRPPGPENSHIAALRKIVDEQTGDYLKVVCLAETVSPATQSVVDDLNVALRQENDRYALERLMKDRPSAHNESVEKLALTNAGIAILSTANSFVGFSGPALAFGALGDDVLSVFVQDETDGGRKGSKWDVIRNNKIIWALIGTGMAIDTYLPKLLDSQSFSQRLVAGGAFFVTATIGSLSKDVKQIIQSGKKLKQLDNEGNLPSLSDLPAPVRMVRPNREIQKAIKQAPQTDDPTRTVKDAITLELIKRQYPNEAIAVSIVALPDTFDELASHMKILTNLEIAKLALRDNMSHPYRYYLLYGLAASLTLSEVGAVFHLLDGLPFSGVIDTSVGAIENIIPTIGMKLHNKFYRARRRIRHWYEEKTAKKTPPETNIKIHDRVTISR